jgi:hypothetical protein
MIEFELASPFMLRFHRRYVGTFMPLITKKKKKKTKTKTKQKNKQKNTQKKN